MKSPILFDLSLSVYVLLAVVATGPLAMWLLGVLVDKAVARGWLERTSSGDVASVSARDLKFMVSFVLVTGVMAIGAQYLLFRGRTFVMDFGIHPLEMVGFAMLLALVVDTNGFFWHRFSHRNKRIYRAFHGGHHRDGDGVHVGMAFYSNTVWDYPVHSGMSLSILVSLLPIATGRYSLVTIVYAMMIYVLGLAAMHSGIRETPVVRWALNIILLPIRILPTAIRTEDHQRHHLQGNCNYGVFFSHWDSLLGSWTPADGEAKRESRTA